MAEIREVTQEEFLAHIAEIYDGKTEIPATYTYKTEVQHVRLGQAVDDMAYETFKLVGNSIEMTKIGSQGINFKEDKEKTLQSLTEFFRKDLGFRFYIGMERKMSVLSNLE